LVFSDILAISKFLYFKPTGITNSLNHVGQKRRMQPRCSWLKSSKKSWSCRPRLSVIFRSIR